MSTRPWRNYAKVPIQEPKVKPIISESIINVPTQRLIVVSSYVVLSGFKLVQPKSLANFIFFSVAESLFWYLLPILSIPWLILRPKYVFLFIFSCVTFNYVWFMTDFSISTVISALLAPLALISPGPMNGDDLITGRYVVDFLPEASARLSTVGNLCLNSDFSQFDELQKVISKSSETVYLQLEVVNAWPSTVIIGRQLLEHESNYTQVTFTKSQLKSLPADKSKIYLPVKEPGAYYLDRIVDGKSGLRVTIDRHRIVVPPCPAADLRLGNAEPVCPGTTVNATVDVYGVQPFKIYLENEIIDIGSTHVDEESQLEKVEVVKLSHEVSKVFDSDSNFKVVKVIDNLGHVTNVDISKPVHVLKPVKANLPNAHIAMPQETARFDFFVEGSDFPCEAKFHGPDGEFIYNVKAPGKQTVEVQKTGKYVLESVKGHKCAGIAEGTVDIFEPPQIQVSVEFGDVEDKCAGPKGVDAKIRMKGTAPYKITYEVRRDGEISDSGTTVYNDANALMRFRPTDVGSYKYRILRVEDRYRRLDVNHEFEQYINELPGAELLPVTSTKLCETSSFEANVKIRGDGQFTLKYKIDESINELPVEGKSVVTIKADLADGTHRLSLISLTDRKGCVTELKGLKIDSPVISVQKALPTIGFVNSGIIKSTDPVRVGLPLAGIINFPASIVYRHKLNNKTTKHTSILRSPKDLIEVYNSGSYQLESLHDDMCGGYAKPDEVHVSTYTKPKLTVDTELTDLQLCSHESLTNTFKEVNIKISGVAPFVVVHEQVSPDGKSLVTKSSYDEPHFVLALDNNQIGDYTHYFWVMDTWYTAFNQHDVNLKFKHTVHDVPNAFFEDKDSSGFRVCEDEHLHHPIIPKIIGKAPYNLTYELNNIQTAESLETIDFAQQIGVLKSHTKKLKLVNITDSNGCSSDLSVKKRSLAHRKQVNELSFHVLPKPERPIFDRLDYCAGDQVSLTLDKRSQPLGIVYSYMGQTHHSVVDKKFEEVVTEPGTLQIISLSGSNGCVNWVNSNITIHSLPKSNIIEQSHFSIYKGEQIELGFSFQGTPPFKFAYARIVNGKEMERNWVENVEGFNHSIIVDKDGTYEIVELYDKYCRSVRTRL